MIETITIKHFHAARGPSHGQYILSYTHDESSVRTLYTHDENLYEELKDETTPVERLVEIKTQILEEGRDTTGVRWRDVFRDRGAW